jgi:apolipoprotein N-acyltransferase
MILDRRSLPAGVRNLSLSLLGGLLAALAFPNPWAIGLDWPGGGLVWVCLVPLLWVRDPGGSPWRYWRWGFVFGLADFGTATFWMSRMPALGDLAPAAWLTLSAYLALYPAFFLVGLRALTGRGIPDWAAAAPLWVVLEFVRNYLLSGFPWAQLGYALHRDAVLMSLAPFAGVWAMSWAAVQAGALLADLGALGKAAGWRWPLWRDLALAQARIHAPRLAALAGLSLLLTGGAFLEHHRLTVQPGSAVLRAAALQGNIDQNRAWNEEYKRSTLETFRGLLEQARRDGADLVVWPESAFPGIFNWDLTLAATVKEWSRTWGVWQAVGSDTFERNGTEVRYFNSVVTVDPEGRMRGLVSKVHLVPFGEYLPFKAFFLRFFTKVVARYGAGDFTPGAGRAPLECSGPAGPMRFGVLICFESLFPQYAAELTRRGGEFLVVTTLDTWFGTSAAPAQHAIFSALRAAENGRTLVRSAATGISCVFDPSGRRTATVPLNTAGVAAVSLRGRTLLTTFTRWGPWFVWVCLALCLWNVLPRRKNLP